MDINLKPKYSDTKITGLDHEWTPTNFHNLLGEIEHIKNACEGEDAAPLFRGQASKDWLLDSTILRNYISQVLGVNESHTLNKDIRNSLCFHQGVLSFVLLKFGLIMEPSEENYEFSKVNNLDAWFELFKRYLQYPEEDTLKIKGNFFVDWTQSINVSLYFALYLGKKKNRHIPETDSALWILDRVASDSGQQIKKVGKILTLMNKDDFYNGNKTYPLLFYPPKQTKMPRAENQDPVYIAQMDYSKDLAEHWCAYERDNKKKVFIKLIIKNEIKQEIAEYLEKHGINEKFIYPE